MIVIEDTIVSETIVQKQFVCNLNACKGACCVKGDRGAPLESEEVDIIRNSLDKIAPYMNPEFLRAIEETDIYEQDTDGDLVTTCQASGECNFVIYENGIAACSIEKAFNAGVIDFRKPVSCHLYPVRIKKYKEFTAVNYNEWSICSPACALGEELKVPVYEFLKTALIRRFGSEWYEALVATAKHLEDEAKNGES